MDEMTYEPRDKTPTWFLTIEAHNAAARLAEHDEECTCAATGDGDFNSKPGHAQFADALRSARGANLYLGVRPSACLWRGGVEVARWRRAQ